ncbi:unnamed protein product [Effrenium voratum]|nr:unnamed protein product [Effrenium voratum]
MAFVHFAASILAVFSALHLCRAEPAFPEGIGAIANSVRKRQESVEQPDVSEEENLSKLKAAARKQVEGGLLEQDEVAALQDDVRNAVLWAARRQLLLGGCPRDMSQCPRKWGQGQAGQCVPPDDYTGLCAAVDLKGWSWQQKEEFAWRCDAHFPCAKACLKDYSSCPQGWDDIQGICVATPAYLGECAPVLDFSDFSLAEKSRIAALCHFSWPCKGELANAGLARAKGSAWQGVLLAPATGNQTQGDFGDARNGPL